MEIQKYIDSKNELLTNLLSFIDSTEANEQKEFFKYLDYLKFDENLDEFQLFIRLLMIISNYYYRNSGFFGKIEQIILHFENIIKQNYSNCGIYKLFCSNRRIVLFIIKQKIITMDLEILDLIYFNTRYLCYFYPEIKHLIRPELKNMIELAFQDRYKCTFEDFDKKRYEGENDSYICYLIRNDLIVEFVTYTSQSNISLTSRIPISLFETNAFLQVNKPMLTLIEYAAFFGSIQIFNYLRMNQVEMKFSLWYYAMHSNNAELIHLLEEFHIEKNGIMDIEERKIYDFPDYLARHDMRSEDDDDYYYKYDSVGRNVIPNENNSFEIILENSIRFHNDKFINYIFENYIQDSPTISANLFTICIKYHYYRFFPTDANELYNECIMYLCIYNYLSLTDILMLNLNNINSDDVFYGCVDSHNQKLLQHFIDNDIIKIEKLKGCRMITEITIPSFVEVIEPNTFLDCYSLKKIDIPSSVKEIGYNAFKGCSSLKQITIPSSLLQYGGGIFQGCRSLENIDIRCSFTIVLDSMFYGCSSLKQITISESVSEICNKAFCYCSSLQQISIPKYVKRIGENAFDGCYSLKHVSFSSSSFLKIIDKCAFRDCSSLIDVKLPDSVSYIGDYAFSRCKSLIEISLPLTLSYIQAYAFSGCKSLENIEIPPLIKKINFGLFKGCLSLKNVIIPPSVIEIEASSFKNCPFLKKEMFPSTVAYIDEFVFGRDQ